MHLVGEDVAAGQRGVAAERRAETAPVEDVVAEDQRDAVVTDEVGADDERLGQSVRRGLDRIRDLDAPRRAVPEQPAELVDVLRRRDDEDLADAGHHQRGQRVVDHRLVVDGHELLADAARDRVQPRSRTAGEDDPLHGGDLTGPGRTTGPVGGGSSRSADPGGGAVRAVDREAAVVVHRGPGARVPRTTRGPERLVLRAVDDEVAIGLEDRPSAGDAGVRRPARSAAAVLDEVAVASA